ncbi:MAG: hypothetical protein FHP92_01555 [Denitromonas halophila]|nr:MAG: hypothetical protein FHP92_01555 [Denitromonas halophila]
MTEKCAVDNFIITGISRVILLRFVRVVICLVFFPVFSSFADTYQIGTYYFPGWKDHQVGAPSPFPWRRIQKFPEREPVLGWYDEGKSEVMAEQLAWMKSHGIDFVVFDWYYGRGQKVMLEHALATYMRSPARKGMRFSLLWANHSGMPENMGDWRAMVSYWVKYYFPRTDFLRIDGKPVVFVFSADYLSKQAAKFGATTRELMESAQVLARESGLPGIAFVAGTGAYLSMIDRYASDSGYSAFSTYNYHSGPMAPLDTPSHSFADLDLGYRAHWQRFAEKGSLPLIVPMTSGWDKRPWGGSKDPAHDNSMGSPEEFGAHLDAAKVFMDENPALTRRMGVICCWNEFGEGSYIEPTKKDGFRYLEEVKRVFGAP